MRHRSVIVLAAALLFAGGLARADEPARVEKITLSHFKPDTMVGTILRKAGAPKGVIGILGYPLDNSLLVRGSVEAIEALKDGIALADVPITKEGEARVASLTLRKAQVAQLAAIREAVLKLPASGSAEIKGNVLTVRGKEAWVFEAIARAMRVEMSAGGIELDAPLPKKEAAGAALGVPETEWITVLIPAGVEVSVRSERARYDPQKGELRLSGSPKVKAPGFDIAATRDILMTVKPGEPTVIRILEQDEPARMTFPYSKNLAFEGDRIAYTTELQRFEAAGSLKVSLPNGVVAEVRNGKAVSTALRTGEAVELTVTPH